MMKKISLVSWIGLLFIAACLIPNPLFGQDNLDSTFPHIKINITARQFKSLQSSKGAKLTLKNVGMTINGDSARIKDIHLRGNNTLYFKRKSFSVDLEKSLSVVIQGQPVKLKKFHLLNLAMDKNLWHNRWSFLTMSQLGLFPPFNSYCLVTVNDQSQGIYLLVEKPQYASETMNSPYTIRRGVDHAIDHEYDETKSKVEAKGYKNQYYSLYETKGLSDESLYQHLNQGLNTDLYFTWVSFNYLIMNGDYSDELFLYINPNTQVYDVMAWDYDDLFMSHPHEGNTVRNQNNKERLMFSQEDELDRIIASDDYVYSKYQEKLKELLLTCDSATMVAHSKKVIDELTWLSSNPIHSNASLYVDRDPFVMKDAQYDIEKSMEYLITRRIQLLRELESVPEN